MMLIDFVSAMPMYVGVNSTISSPIKVKFIENHEKENAISRLTQKNVERNDIAFQHDGNLLTAIEANVNFLSKRSQKFRYQFHAINRAIRGLQCDYFAVGKNLHFVAALEGELVEVICVVEDKNVGIDGRVEGDVGKLNFFGKIHNGI